MKIISLQAENVKKLVAVEIKPGSNVVEITGKNGQGKTSVLDSIWWALTGAEHIQTSPIRKGAKEARIRLDLGDIIVTRKFASKEDGGYTTSLAVENADGARFPSPQKMLDSLLGELSFDPLAFARMKPKEQFDALRQFVPGVDFAAIDNANRGDFQKRTDVNRSAKEARAAAQLIDVPTDTPEQPIDESALVAELENAGELNAETERRSARRAQAVRDIADLRTKAAKAKNDIETYTAERQARCNERVDEWLRQMEELKRRIEAEKEAAKGDISATAAQLAVESVNSSTEADELQEKLDNAEPLPPPIDTAAVRTRIEQARAINASVRKLNERMAHHKRAVELEKQADDLTARMEKRTAEKQAAIAAAKMPVPGIEFGDGEILLAGVPFNQGSDAEQLRASVAIAMAMNPKLRVIRIRDGSLLDEDAMALVGEMAEANDMQVWIERVDSSGKIGFVLEDGHIKQTQSEEAAA